MFGEPGSRRTTLMVAFVVALVGTIAFYLPVLSMYQPGAMRWPGFMLSHDQRAFYFPSFVEGYRRFWEGGLFGIDFLTSGGGSVFSFRQNLLPFYPPYLLTYLLFDCSNLKTAAAAYLLINAAHQFVGLFFTVVFVRRYLGLPTAGAVLAASLFALSYQAGFYVVFATFYFQMMLIPLAACTLCWLMSTRSLAAAILVSPVFVVFALSNYVPTMVAAMGTAVLAALAAFYASLDERGPRPWRDLYAPTLSLVIAVAVTAPYFGGQWGYKHVMMGTANDLRKVAYDLALSGRDIVNGLSQFLAVDRAATEGALVWGLVPVFFAFAGLEVILARRSSAPPRLGRFIACALTIYLPTLLVSFGSSIIPATQAFYYAVPVLGDMHIYHRYLAFTQFAFAMAIAGLAVAATYQASDTQRRWFAYAGLALWLGVMLVFYMRPPSPEDISAPEFLGEVFLLAIVAVAVGVLPARAAVLTAAVLAPLVGLYAMYSVSTEFSKPVLSNTEPSPIGPEVVSIVGFIAENKGDKALPHLLLADPDINPYINRNFSWLVGSQVKFMNFAGYPPHLSMLQDYGASFADYRRYDAAWVGEAGLDFVYWNDETAESLDGIIGAGFRIGKTLDLPDGNHLAVLERDPQGRALLDLGRDRETWPQAYVLDGWAIQDRRLVKVEGGADHFGYPVAQTPGETYEIAFMSDPGSRGSLTVALGNKVVGEVAVEGAARHEIAATTDAIGDLWVTASPDFVGSVSDITVRDTFASFDNGIFRIDSDAGSVEAFASNYASFARMTVDARLPVTVTSLLWPNPYMQPYLDGERVAWIDPSARPRTVLLPAGRHEFELRFESGWATAFSGSMFAFALLLVGAAGWQVRGRAIRGRLRATRLSAASTTHDTRLPRRADLKGVRTAALETLRAARQEVAARPAAMVAASILVVTLVLTLLVNFAMVEVLGIGLSGLPYLGEDPALRGNDLSRLMAAAAGFQPIIGSEAVMPGEPVPYPPFAFLVIGVLAAVPTWLAWPLFYAPALGQGLVAQRFSTLFPRPGLAGAFFVAILLVYPFLYVLDRANLDMHVGLLCFGALALVAGGYPRFAAIAIGLAAALKIYPVVLFCLFVRRDRRALALGVAVAAGATGIALLALHMTPPEAIAFVRAQVGRTEHCFATPTLCLNLSAAVPFKVVFAQIVSVEWYASLSRTAYVAYSATSLVLALCVLAYVALRPGRLWLDALRLTLVMTLLPVMSYDYKLLLFLGPLYLALREAGPGRRDAPRAVAIMLMAVMLASWKWLGQTPHLWIHAIAQLGLVGVAIVASRFAETAAGADGMPTRRWRGVQIAGALVVAAVAALGAWGMIAQDAVRSLWAARSSWCAADLTFTTADPVPIWGDGWGPFEGEPGGHWRWTTAEVGRLHLPLDGVAQVSGVVALPPGFETGTIELRVDGMPLERLDMATQQPFSIDIEPTGDPLSVLEFAVSATHDVDGRSLGLALSRLHVATACK